eukprot:GFUD01024074.1.p1 GENE.GFUD01024074.1~~GFUD01024074.1.p1  ORF type:complete len:898 (-),score=219.17 GFUD01024074.1:81-2774(-)
MSHPKAPHTMKNYGSSHPIPNIRAKLPELELNSRPGVHMSSPRATARYMNFKQTNSFIDCVPENSKGSQLQQSRFKVPHDWGALKLGKLDIKPKVEKSDLTHSALVSDFSLDGISKTFKDSSTLNEESKISFRNSFDSKSLAVNDSFNEMIDDVLNGLEDLEDSFTFSLDEDFKGSSYDQNMANIVLGEQSTEPESSEIRRVAGDLDWGQGVDYEDASDMIIQENSLADITEAAGVGSSDQTEFILPDITPVYGCSQISDEQVEQIETEAEAQFESNDGDADINISSDSIIDQLNASGIINDEIELRELEEKTCSVFSSDVTAQEVKDEFCSESKSKRRFYSATFKSQVLDYYVQNGPTAAARKFGLSKFLVLEWKRNAGVAFVQGTCIKDKEIVLRNPIRIRRKYDLTFKEEVLDYCEQFGVTKTCQMFDVTVQVVYSWRKDGVESKPFVRYSSEFIEDAVKTCEKEGFRKTAKSLNLSPKTLWAWKVKAGKPSSKLKFTYQFKKEVVDYYSKHGSKSACKKFTSVDSSQLCKWKKKFASVLEPEAKAIFLNTEKQKFQAAVLKFAKENGLKAAAIEFNVSLPNIWDWKSKENKRFKQVKARKAAKRRPGEERNFEYSQELKNTIVEYYQDHGSKACEDQFHVPRQTVRNWALKMGEAEIGLRNNMINVERVEVLEMARSEGVKKALQKYPVKRATLYYWAKALGAEVSEGLNKTVELIVTQQQGIIKKLVFGRIKKPKREKIKRVKQIKVKPKKPEVVVSSLELPTWASDFIKKKPPNLPCVLSSESNPLLSLESSSTLLSCDIFSLSLPVTSLTSPEAPLDLIDSTNVLSKDLDPSQSSDSSSESEYECDDDSDFLLSLPYFSPTPQFYDASLITVDPPNTIRKRRMPGQGTSK